MKTAKFIFLAVNNNDDPSIAEGGSHWSLLAVSSQHGVALHYDSLNGCNESEARATTSKLASLLKLRITLFLNSLINE
jgi:sentrin-specific protease 8